MSGGVSITYQASKESPTEDEMSDTIYKLQRVEMVQYRGAGLESKSCHEPKGDNRIIVEIPGVTDANKILKNLENQVPCILLPTRILRATKTIVMTLQRENIS